MRTHIAIVYNEPYPSCYDSAGENGAVVEVLQTVKAAYNALHELGYHITRVPLFPPADRVRETLADLSADLVFNLFEGLCGAPETEALVPEIMEARQIPYTGCPGKALRLALDKAMMKELLKASGIKTPDFQLLNPYTLHTFRFGFPCIVKPRHDDASHGISAESVVTGPSGLAEQVRTIYSRYDDDALVEEFLDGQEYNATVIGNASYTVLPVSEIVYTLPPDMPEILTFAAKWQHESIYYQNTRAVCPAPIEAEQMEPIAAAALSAYRLLNCKGYARVDMRLDRKGDVNVIEVNPNPDITPGSGAARQADAAGMSYTRFIEKIVQIAIEENIE
jgi:D-alanine-D-alanine ligase